jgi:hypothetical protein
VLFPVRHEIIVLFLLEAFGVEAVGLFGIECLAEELFLLVGILSAGDAPLFFDIELCGRELD